MTWFLDEKVQKQIRDFNINHLKQINEFHYFKEYNEHYDLINCIHLHIPYESEIYQRLFCSNQRFGVNKRFLSFFEHSTFG